MKIVYLMAALLVLDFSCTTTKKIDAAINIQDVKFLVDPYVLNKNEDYYLVYKIDIGEQKSNVRLQIGERSANNKFYYFFIERSSFPEYSDTVFRPVSRDEGIVRLFKSGSVFWLNPDTTEVKLKIVIQ